MREVSGDPVRPFPGDGFLKPDRIGIARLRKEVAKLKAERGILEKAAAWFARDAT